MLPPEVIAVPVVILFETLIVYVPVPPVPDPKLEMYVPGVMPAPEIAMPMVSAHTVQLETVSVVVKAPAVPPVNSAVASPINTGAPAPVARAGLASPPTHVRHISRGWLEPSTVNRMNCAPTGAGASSMSSRTM